MLRGLWRLTWLEIKIFVREPLGVIGTVGIPVLLFVVLARLVGPRTRTASAGVSPSCRATCRSLRRF
jgi:ABC-2 type transport system permease protein